MGIVEVDASIITSAQVWGYLKKKEILSVLWKAFASSARAALKVKPLQSFQHLFTMMLLPDSKNQILRNGLKVLISQITMRLFPSHLPILLCRPFNYLCKNPELVTLLQGLSEGYDISPLLRYLLPHFICSIVKSDAGKLACVFTVPPSLTER